MFGFNTKSLSQKDFIQDDKTTGKIQDGLVIFGLHFQSGHDPAKVIHPAMCPLDDSAIDLVVRFSALRYGDLVKCLRGFLLVTSDRTASEICIS